jgi:Protein of unknown function (DUF2530)
VAPVDVDGVRAVAVGTVAWAIAAVVLVVLRGRLAPDVAVQWIWTCVVGAGLGVLGVGYCIRRREAIRRDATRTPESAADQLA